MTGRDTPSPPYALLLLAAGAGLMIGLVLAIPPWPQVVEHGPVEPGEMRVNPLHAPQYRDITKRPNRESLPPDSASPQEAPESEEASHGCA